MAKPKHPTLKSLRQGQTIYIIFDDSFQYRGIRPKYVRSYLLHSHNTPWPEAECVVDQIPVNHIKRAVQRGNFDLSTVYYSRRRAEGACKSIAFV